MHIWPPFDTNFELYLTVHLHFTWKYMLLACVTLIFQCICRAPVNKVIINLPAYFLLRVSAI